MSFNFPILTRDIIKYVDLIPYEIDFYLSHGIKI